jgi:hypothetical protein
MRCWCCDHSCRSKTSYWAVLGRRALAWLPSEQHSAFIQWLEEDMAPGGRLSEYEADQLKSVRRFVDEKCR